MSVLEDRLANLESGLTALQSAAQTIITLVQNGSVPQSDLDRLDADIAALNAVTNSLSAAVPPAA